jgi:hypothetical protein
VIAGIPPIPSGCLAGSRCRAFWATINLAWRPRGQAENHIKAWKNHLAADRTSCHGAEANQFRLFLHAGAYWLLWSMRRVMPKRSICRVWLPEGRGLMPPQFARFPSTSSASPMQTTDSAAAGASPHAPLASLQPKHEQYHLCFAKLLRSCINRVRRPWTGSRKHRLPISPAIALLQDAMPRPGLPLVDFNDTRWVSIRGGNASDRALRLILGANRIRVL